MYSTEKRRDLFREITLKTFFEEVKKLPFSSRDMIGFFMTYLFGFFEDEHVFAVFFDKNRMFSGILHIQDGVVIIRTPMAETIESRAVDLGASSFVLAHNHPGVPAVPSAEDVLLTGDIKRYFEKSDISFLDHFIVSGYDFSTMMTETLWRKRYDGGQLTVF